MRVVTGVADVADPDAFVAALGDVGDDHGCVVQAVDARLVAGREHLRTAVERARRAVERGENVARDPGVEILLYAAGRRQIDQAMAMGVEAGRGPVAVVDVDCDGGDEAAAAAAVREHLVDPDADPSPDPDAIAAFFDVSAAERAASDAGLEALVCERVALLDVEK